MTGVLARRGYNIQSLAVGNSETADLSRITTVIPGSKESSAKVIKQLLKLIHVHSVTDLSDLPFITRELMLIKCRCKPSERKELIDLAEIFHGNVCDVSRTTITLEVQGKESKMRAVQDLIAPYGKLPFSVILAFCMTGLCIQASTGWPLTGTSNLVSHISQASKCDCKIASVVSGALCNT